jgi:putative toxin-antitoxin system antitoxin component (TIGR02293 family)
MGQPERRNSAVATPRAHRGARQGNSLGLKISNSADLIQQVERGFSFKALQTFAERSGIAVPRIATLLAIPGRTMARRKSSRKLSWEESERLLRLAAVYEDAVQLFEGDASAAMNWLNSRQKTLGNNTPLVHSRTEIGAREVEDLVGRLEYGVFS